MSTTSTASRNEGLDIARALAILGMFVVHAVLVLGREIPAGGVHGAIFWLCDGRAAATFVTLAGLGITRLVDRLPPSRVRPVLCRRALFLGALGVLNLVLWEGDILRVYGVAFLSAPLLLRLGARARAGLAVGLVALFPVLAWAYAWDARWDFATLTYRGLWEPAGFVRNLLFDGFRPVVPWLAFFLLGMNLGRADLSAPAARRRLLATGVVLTALALAAAPLLDAGLAAADPSLPDAERWAVVGTGSLPPMPLFMISAVGTTCLALACGPWLATVLPDRARRALVATGRRALTWYVAHIVLLVALYVAGVRNAVPVAQAMAWGLTGFLLAAVYSALRHQTPGWWEQALRQVGGR